MPQHDGKPTEREIRARGAGVETSHVHDLTARPKCAVCVRPVDRMTEEEDTYRDVVIFTASCHGERERIVIPMGDERLKGISFGVAFAGAPRQIEGGG